MRLSWGIRRFPWKLGCASGRRQFGCSVSRNTGGSNAGNTDCKHRQVTNISVYENPAYYTFYQRPGASFDIKLQPTPQPVFGQNEESVEPI